jgi:hypothetical protein
MMIGPPETISFPHLDQEIIMKQQHSVATRSLALGEMLNNRRVRTAVLAAACC